MTKEMPSIEEESVVTEAFPKKFAEKIWRYKGRDGKYHLAADKFEIDEEIRYREDNNMTSLEFYDFKDAEEEEDGTITGINDVGDRIKVLDPNER